MPESSIDEAVASALAGKPVKTTPRKLVQAWGASRRGRNVVAKVRRYLKRKKVTTLPDFESVWLDEPIRIVALEAAPDPPQPTVTVPESTRVPETVAEPAHRISRLRAATGGVISLKPGDTLDLAVTLMMQHDYSQLPVMPNRGTVSGMVSWRSIGRRLHLGATCSKVEQCMEKAHEVPETASMFEAVRLLATHDALLVRTGNGSISGIITNADIGAQFGTLAEPFLLLADIENALRHLIERAFTLKELKAAIDPVDGQRKMESISDLTFGEYLRLIEKPAHWERLQLTLDRAEVVKKLEIIRVIRNDVMHFDPDPLEPESLELLRSFSRFLAGLLDVVK